jgi:DNA-binding response OmpR family regulator
VLLARIGALMRRTAGWRRQGVESCGEIAFDEVRGVVTIGGEAQALTQKEFKLARLLLANPHRTLARTYLMEEVWGGPLDPLSRTLDTHIKRVKTKLRLTPERGFNFVSVYGYGYRVSRLAAARVDAAA